MIKCHFVWPAVHMPERGRETRLVPVALSSFISIREVYYLWCHQKALKAHSNANTNACLLKHMVYKTKRFSIKTKCFYL